MRWMMVLAAAALMVGCGSQTRLESDLGVDGPDWVNKGTAYVDDDGGRFFHGVGSAGEMGDASLQRSVADDRARAELAKIFSAYLDVVGTDYQAAAKAAGGASAADEAVTRQIKALSQVNLAGAKIIARWVDAKRKVIWSIAEIDLKQVKNTAAVAAGMNGDLQRYVGAQADNVFDRVAKGAQ